MNFRTLTEADLISIRSDKRYTAQQRGDADRELIRRADQKRIAAERASADLFRLAKSRASVLERVAPEGELTVWAVKGPGKEELFFDNRKDASLYQQFRGQCDSQQEALSNVATFRAINTPSRIDNSDRPGDYEVFIYATDNPRARAVCAFQCRTIEDAKHEVARIQSVRLTRGLRTDHATIRQIPTKHS